MIWQSWLAAPQDWAKSQLTPREEEITQLRELIRRIEADVAELTDSADTGGGSG
jgi:hypothetical protein